MPEPSQPDEGDAHEGGVPASPFGFDLSAIDFTQLARMLSHTGPLNWEIARQTADWVATGGTDEPPVDAAIRVQLEELAHAAQTRVVTETGIAAMFAARVEVVDRRGWVRRHEEALRPVLEALATRFGDLLQAESAADLEDEPEGMPEGMETSIPGLPGVFSLSPEMLSQLLPQIAPLLLGVQTGSMLGYLAQHALGRYDWPLPAADEPTLCFVARNLAEFEAAWSLPPTDLRFYVALHEALHASLRSRPWLRDRLVSLTKDYAAAYELDADTLADAFGELDPSDPASIQRLTADPERLLGAMQSERQRAVLGELQQLHALLGSYADALLERLAAPLIGSFPQIHEAMKRHRIERGEADRFVEGLLGCGVDRAADERADAFCAGVIERAGVEGLNRLWEAPHLLPTPAELDAPGLWLARIELPDLGTESA